MFPDFNNPIFRDETKAREWLEAELWPDGPVCPHCGVLNGSTKVHGATGALASICATIAAHSSR